MLVNIHATHTHTHTYMHTHMHSFELLNTYLLNFFKSHASVAPHVFPYLLDVQWSNSPSVPGWPLRHASFAAW